MLNSDILSFSAKIREKLLERESSYLSPYALRSSDSVGRSRNEISYDGEFRLSFQRDRDRIIHSKEFRRLKGKTQVFLYPIGDHFRTRMTHTLEVAQISRTIARALSLNEDLTEAIALGHDLGHTPFGHFGERALSKIAPDGFHHAKQSQRIAQRMNLTLEVCDGIAKHSKGKGLILNDDLSRYASSLEGQIVRVADIIAYLNHDLDDAQRAGMITKDSVPSNINKVIGNTPKQRISIMVYDVISSTSEMMGKDFKDSVKRIYMSEEVMNVITELRSFLFNRVYENEKIMADYQKVYRICSDLFEFFTRNTDALSVRMQLKEMYDTPERMAVDYISGMTDKFAFDLYDELFGG